MSNKETLQNYNNKLIKNNDDLQTVIDMINNLPEAGEGGGGAIKKLKYTELEYMEHSEDANQWLQTDYKLSSNSRVVAKFTRKINASWLENGTIVGAYKNNDSNFLCCYRSNSGSYQNRIEWYYGTESKLFYNVPQTDFEIDLNKNSWKAYAFGGTSPIYSHTFANTTFETAYETPIMGSMANGKIGNLAWGRLYYVQIYDGDTLLYDVIPVKDPDGVICGYNKVTDTFMYNQGTGVFVGGPEGEKVYEEIKIEDVTEDIDDYGNKLTIQEEQLLVIAETLKNKAAGANINIFVQEDEPEKKEGLWIKTSQTKPNNISINKLGLKLEWAWEKWTTPVQTAYNRVVKYKNYLYSFCGRNASNSPVDAAFKFNLKTNTAETITSYPITSSGPAIGIVGDRIYLFGGASADGKTAQSYMYDILSNTYTSISPLPEVLQQSGFATAGTDIYIIGGSGASGNSTSTYKYNTLTDTYTKLANLPVGMCTQACVYKEGYIYMFGGLKSGGYNQTSYKYDIANNTYTTIKSFPVNRGHYAAGIIGDDIYVFGGYYGGRTYIYDVYKYDTTNDTYTKMPNMSNTWFNGGYVSDGNIVYLVNGEHLEESNDLNVISKYGYINKKEFVNDTIVISTDEDLYNANILNNVNTYFNDVLLYSVAENVYQTNLPAYYGDGEKWISLRGEE